MKSYVLVMLFATLAHASLWQRHVQSGKGDSFDSPRPHPLAYFTRNPFLRDDADQFCSACTQSDKAAMRSRHKFRTEVRKVGKLYGFTVYDVFYSFDDDIATKQIDWKSILVEVSPGQFREIYHLQPIAGQIKPSFFLKVGAEEILVTRDLIPGTGNNYYEDYFWLSPSGAARIDIEAIIKAVQSVLPPGLGVWNGGGLHIGALRYHMRVWKESDSHCCPTGGSVDIRFRLDGSRIVVTSKRYDPRVEPVD